MYLLEHLLKVPSVSGFEDKAVKCYEDLSMNMELMPFGMLWIIVMQ